MTTNGVMMGHGLPSAGGSTDDWLSGTVAVMFIPERPPVPRITGMSLGCPKSVRHCLAVILHDSGAESRTAWTASLIRMVSADYHTSPKFILLQPRTFSGTTPVLLQQTGVGMRPDRFQDPGWHDKKMAIPQPRECRV